MLERSNKTVIADYFQFLCVLQNVVRIPKNLISYKPEMNGIEPIPFQVKVQFEKLTGIPMC